MTDQSPSDPIQIGQDSSAVQAAEALLESDGAKVLEAYILTQLSAADAAILANPGIAQVFDFVIKSAVDFIVEKVDDVAFAGVVSIATGIQVSNYIKDSSNNVSQAQKDQDAADLISLQDDT